MLAARSADQSVVSSGWRYYEDRARRNLRNRAYNIFMKLLGWCRTEPFIRVWKFDLDCVFAFTYSIRFHVCCGCNADARPKGALRQCFRQTQVDLDRWSNATNCTAHSETGKAWRLADTSEPRNRYKKAMKKVLRYVVELEYGDKQPASHQEACPFTQDPAQ